MSAPNRAMHFESGKLWSLWDFMHRFPIANMIEMDVQIVGAISTADLTKGAEHIGQEGVESVRAALTLFEMLGAADPDFAPEAFNLVRVAHSKLAPDMARSVAMLHLASVHNVFRSELSKKGCFLLTKEEMAYVDQPALFGQSVAEAFPSAAIDIREAGNCFAAERYNACAYHCVQAAEIGLRELARDRRAQPTMYGKPLPLEFTQWGELIRAIKSETDKIRTTWPIGEVKDFAQQFYEQALLDANGINDGWRRHLSHARTHAYEHDEVLGLIAHARRFLQTLSKRIGERRTVTPLVWKRVPPELRP